MRTPAGLLELELNVEVGHFLMKKAAFQVKPRRGVMRRQVTTEEIESVDRVMEAIGVVLVVAPPRIPAKLGLRL